MNRYTIKLQAAWRLLMLSRLSKVIPYYLVTEFPKSGGSWLSQMLAEALELPFPRQCFPKGNSCIMHGHYLKYYTDCKTIVMWRDPRDVMVSWYYHCLFPFDLSHDAHLNFIAKVRKDLAFNDIDDIRANMPVFIEYCFTRQRTPKFTWLEFFQAWYGREDVVQTSYEKLRHDTPTELMRILAALGSTIDRERLWVIVNQYSFETMTGRKPGQEAKNAFIRKGIVGDWMTIFSREAAEMMAFYVNDALVRLGYEPDGTWVKTLG